MTYASTVRDGRRQLRVTTNFVWVYAFEGTTHRIAVAHDEIQWEFPATKDLRADDRGMWIGRSRSYSGLVDCAAAAKGLLAPTRVGGEVPAAPGEDPEELLRADHPLDIRDDCR